MKCSQSSQINGELQFITKTFDQYEAEIKEKEKVIIIYRGKMQKCQMS